MTLNILFARSRFAQSLTTVAVRLQVDDEGWCQDGDKMSNIAWLLNPDVGFVLGGVLWELNKLCGAEEDITTSPAVRAEQTMQVVEKIEIVIAR